MDQPDFQDLVRRTALRMSEDAAMFNAVALHLPPLPLGCEYYLLEGFHLRSLASLRLVLKARDRTAATSLMMSFHPLAAVWLDTQAPYFQPVTAIHPDLHLQSRAVFPVVFTAWYDPAIAEDAGRYQANLAWYWQPIVSQPYFRVAIDVSIVGDPSRVYATDATGLPRGDTPKVLPEVEGSGRNLVVTWPHDVTDWLDQLTTVQEEEWTDLITESEQ